MVDFNAEQANSGRFGDYSKDAWEKLINFIDSQTLSPSQRAAKIYEIVQLFYDKKENPQWDWDLLCFCEELLINLSQDIKFLVPIARELNKKVYQHHYQLAYEIGLIDPGNTSKNESKSKDRKTD